MLGWYLGVALIWTAIAWSVFRAIYLALTIDLPWLGVLLGGLGEALKIGVFAWVMLRFWKKLQREFKQPNQPPEPTPPSVTDRADARSAPAGGAAHL
jgi:hypothetical protein